MMDKFIFAIVLAFAGPVLATDIAFPIFEPNVFCKSFGAANAQYPNGLAEKSCLSNEQEAYDEARSIWAEAADPTKRLCAEMAGREPAKSHVAYEVLAQCLTVHNQQDRLMNQGSFKY